MGRAAEKISAYTTFRLGGLSRELVVLRTPAQLIAAVKRVRAEKLPYRLLAGGSNVVVSDKFFPGVTIIFHQPRGVCQARGQEVICPASVPLSNLVRTAGEAGLAGLESLAGIPGTVGGAVVGNAGAYGQNISNYLEALEIWDGQKRRWLKKDDCRFAYRDSIFKQKSWLVLEARFKLVPGKRDELLTRAREIIKIRRKKYPPGLACPGSFFKNVLASKVSKKSLKLVEQSKIIDGKIPAGYLLEAVGAKGMKLGGIAVAPYHGNLILNTGGGTYAEVKKLAAKLKQKVKRKFGIKLEEEVRYL